MLMLQQLIGSSPARSWFGGGTAVSAAVHGGAVLLIALSAGEPGPIAHETRSIAVEHVTFVRTATLSPTRHAASAATSAHRSRSSRSVRRRLASMPDQSALRRAVDESLERATPIPALELEPIAADWLSRPDSLSIPAQSVALTLMGQMNWRAPVDGVYSESMVDRTVEARRTNPLPRYPETLRRRGIEGSFYVQFVVDTTGRVVDDGIVFPPSMHELFVRSVRAALRQSHFFPARVAGQVVNQLVIQEYRFVLVR
jgi:TonB family protein